MRKLFFIFVVCAFSIPAFAQDTSKPWSDWSKKDAEKVLNESAWGQSYTQEIAAPTSTAATTRTSGGFAGENRGESGENKAPTPMKFRVRLLTAKPIREAFSRMVVLQQPNAGDDLKVQLQGFVDRDFGDFLVVSFSVEGGNAQMAKGSEMMLARLTADALKDKVYLERKDGKRATFIDYKAPVGDGMGAKMVFSRTLDGQPFIAGDDVIKFNFDMNEKQKISVKFKSSGMTYGGKLEY